MDDNDRYPLYFRQEDTEPWRNGGGVTNLESARAMCADYMYYCQSHNEPGQVGYLVWPKNKQAPADLPAHSTQIVVLTVSEANEILARIHPAPAKSPKRSGKVPPAISRELCPRYDALSKAAWASIYFDLYRQCFGDTTPEEEIMADAERRLEILKQNDIYGG